jgi:hypothetical protein
MVYSPITYAAEIELYSKVRRGHEYWLAIDYLMLDQATWLHVLMLDGWQESVGVQQEIERFHTRLKGRRGTRFIKPEDYGVKSCGFVGELQSASR